MLAQHRTSHLPAPRRDKLTAIVISHLSGGGNVRCIFICVCVLCLENISSISHTWILFRNHSTDEKHSLILIKQHVFNDRRPKAPFHHFKSAAKTVIMALTVNQ